jgi:ABC-2 type transport system permease protein
MNWQRILGVYFRYLYVVRKGPQQLTDLLYWPFIDIVLWGLTSVWIQKTQPNVSNLPLILMTCLIFWQIAWRAANDVSISMVQEFWHRNLLNLFSTPLKFIEWICGVILLCLTKLMVTISFGSLVIYVLYSLNVFSIGWEFIPFAASVLIFGWAIGFMGSSFVIYWGGQAEAVAWMIPFVFAPFSAVFYPVHVLPTWAQTIAWCLPTTYIFEGMRSILTTGHFPTGYFAASIGLDILYFALALGIFYRSFEKSRAKGLARLE